MCKEILKSHGETINRKNHKMFNKQEQAILALISRKTSLTNQRLDALCRDIVQSLQFTQNDLNGQFKEVHEC